MEVKPPLGQERENGARQIHHRVRPFFLIPLYPKHLTNHKPDLRGSGKEPFIPVSPECTNRKSFLQSIPYPSCCRTGAGPVLGRMMLYLGLSLLTEKGLGSLSVWRCKCQTPASNPSSSQLASSDYPQ